MRWAFVFFLLLNLVYFGWELDRQLKQDRRNAVAAAPPPASALSLRLISESGAQPKVRLSQPVEIGGGRSGGMGSLFAMPEDMQLATELPEITAISMADAAGKFYCYSFGPIEDEVLAVGIGDWFNSRRATTNIRHTDEPGDQLFWIYLTPEASGRDPLAVMNELQNKGIDDYRLISKDELQNAISLGLYRGHEALTDRIGELRQQGYQPVVVPYSEGKRVYWVDVRLTMDPGALDLVFRGFPARYRYVPVDCERLGMQAAGP